MWRPSNTEHWPRFNNLAGECRRIQFSAFIDVMLLRSSLSVLVADVDADAGVVLAEQVHVVRSTTVERPRHDIINVRLQHFRTHVAAPVNLHLVTLSPSHVQSRNPSLEVAPATFPAVRESSTGCYLLSFQCRSAFQPQCRNWRLQLHVHFSINRLAFSVTWPRALTHDDLDLRT